jgi:hypothetical protein
MAVSPGKLKSQPHAPVGQMVITGTLLSLGQPNSREKIEKRSHHDHKASGL